MQDLLDPLAAHRLAVDLSGRLVTRLGWTPGQVTSWWNHKAHPILNRRTALQAWQREEFDAVRALVERMCV
jgi:hypothetical protein